MKGRWSKRIPYQIPYCSCEHSQIAHAETEYGIEFHGHCLVHGCFCKKFTWTSKFHIVKRDLDNQDMIEIGKRVLCETKDRNGNLK